MPEYADHPGTVTPASRFLAELEALVELTGEEIAPTLMVRAKHLMSAYYGFGDASAAGFGSTIQARPGLRVRLGIWGSDADESSSNWRELGNLV
jgi:hypothetical protein